VSATSMRNDVRRCDAAGAHYQFGWGFINTFVAAQLMTNNAAYNSKPHIKEVALPDGWEEHHFGNLAQRADDDFDLDGMKDLAEYDAGADPKNFDTDGDGLPDGWEWSYGFSPMSSAGDDGPEGDPDDDGMTNYEEYVAGTSPNDRQSVFEIAEVLPAGNTAGLRWHAFAGKEYRVLASIDLESWTEVAIIDPGDERQSEWFDYTSNGEPRQFYKLRVMP